MKKAIKTFVLLLCFGIMSGNGSFAGIIPPFDEEIAVKDAGAGIDPEQERSLLPTCQAYKGGNQIEVVFNKFIGQATVLILTQAGTVAGTASADTEFENAVYLQSPASQGTYRLYITGSNGYQGEGEFTVQ